MTTRNFETITKSINSVRNTIYSPGDTIEIDLPASDCAVVNPRGTKLKFNILMTDNNACTQPDGLAGCWSLIKNIQIFDLNTNTLLEQIDEANHLVAMEKHFSSTPSIKNNWELIHGQCPNYTGQSLYYTQQGALGAVQNNRVECVIDLQVSGLFNKSAPLFPNILVGGVRFRITLEDAQRSTTSFPCAELLPLPDDIGKYQWSQGCGGGLEVGPVPPAVAPSLAPPPNSWFEILTAIPAGAATSVVIKNVAPAAAGGPIAFTADSCQIKVGQYLLFRDTAAAAAAVTTITSGAVTAVADLGGALGIQVTFVSTVLPAIAVSDAVWISAANIGTSYQMSQVELLVSSAEMPVADLKDMVAKSSTAQGMNIDYKSWNIYRDNLQAKVSNPQVTLNCTEQRALSLVQMPYNPNATFAQPRPPMRTINDEGINYQYNIANRNTPSRPVPINRVSSNTPLRFDAIHGLEIEKAVERCGTVPRFMCNNNAFFCVGRALSRQQHSFNANMNNIRLSILYSTATTANVINKVLESQMYHIRRLNIAQGSIRVTF